MRPGTRVSFLVVTSLAFTLSLSGQATTGAITGTITHDGQPLPGVTITIASPAMQGTRVAYSYVNGDYNHATLPPGEYAVTFEMEGMTPLTKTVTVGLARIERVNAEMVLVPVAEAVTVTAAAPTVLESTEVQTNYEAKLIENLPVQRTLQSITLLAPGVINGAPEGTGSIIISGGEYFENLWLVNGAVTNENIFGNSENLFIEDAIQEASVMTGSISAEYGRFTGGVVSAITKSGGNEFSGSFRDSLTNPAWTNVSDFGEPKAESEVDETYEATLGGRIVRDRLWFFIAGRYAETQTQTFYTASTVERPPLVLTDERIEAKLTSQVTAKNSLVVSYLDYQTERTNWCQAGCWDEFAMDPWYSAPRYMGAANWNGILTTNLFVEAGYSTRSEKFHDYGGEDPSEVYGTPGRDSTGYGGFFGAPIFCAICDVESRTNDYFYAKLNYYLATPRRGTHNIVAGYENFLEERWANNYQSASNFRLVIINKTPQRDASFNVMPIITGRSDSAFGHGDVLGWFPIFDTTKGDHYVTESVFLNDKWDLNRYMSFNLGVRYDRNDGRDSSGNEVSDDSNVSPRIGVIVDVKGDGRFRVNGSYSKYVAKIWSAEGDRAGAGGNPAYIYYEYRGPTISGLPVHQAFAQLFDWFNAQGGVDATHLIALSGVPGYSTKIDGTLESPNVEEYTIGAGMQLGTRGLLRVDYIDRTWLDFYANTNEPGVYSEPDPYGNVYDLTLITNTNDMERTYQAVQLQGSYRFTDRLSLGGNYTWSKAWGNYWDGQGRDYLQSKEHYAEYKAYPQYMPSGFLPNDRTHVARLWIGYDQPLGRFGNVNVSLLERYETGYPYSEWAQIPVTPYVTNPGYLTPPSISYYHLSDEVGQYRFDSLSATDLALNYELPIRRASMFVQGEVLNLLDEQAQIMGSSAVRLVRRFNPFTETPKECPQGQIDCQGFNWQKPATFGQARSKSDYQLPRTYRFSVGLRF